jgi:ADP-L-glycero-D-manno-heptose 6-epimerase
MDKDEFLKLIKENYLFESFNFKNNIENKNKNKNKIETIFHQGACATTTEWNGRFMMENNYSYSKELVDYSINNNINFIYASSAAVYGNKVIFTESRENEKPINVYGYSKWLFDQYVRSLRKNSHSQIVGLRYFNVYGPGESHKGSMASVAFHLNNQIKKTGKVQLFEGSDGYDNGQQRRDFIYIDDIVNINLFFMENPHLSGIFNAGTGKSEPFNHVAKAVLDWHEQKGDDKSKKGELVYIPFPEHLKNHYQSFTEADMSLLIQVGYDKSFHTVQEGVTKYLDILEENNN